MLKIVERSQIEGMKFVDGVLNQTETVINYKNNGEGSSANLQVTVTKIQKDETTNTYVLETRTRLKRSTDGYMLFDTNYVEVPCGKIDSVTNRDEGLKVADEIIKECRTERVNYLSNHMF